MSNENNEAQTAETPVEGQSGSEPSVSEVPLEDLYGEFTSQETQTPQSTQQTAQPVASAPASGPIPDAVADPEGFKNYVSGMKTELSAAQSSFAQTQAELEEQKQRLAAQQEEQDFRNLAEELAESSDLNPDIAEAGLLHRVLKTPELQTAWRNRAKNPNAWSKIKGHLANDLRKTFSVKVDPQIAENQRAAGEATRGVTGEKPPEKSRDDNLMGMTGPEFDREIERMKRA